MSAEETGPIFDQFFKIDRVTVNNLVQLLPSQARYLV